MGKFLVHNERLTNDRTGKSFTTGDIVTDDDFPKYILQAWLERGYVSTVRDDDIEEGDEHGSDSLGEG